jgi:hypothetical protein
MLLPKYDTIPGQIYREIAIVIMVTLLLLIIIICRATILLEPWSPF